MSSEQLRLELGLDVPSVPRTPRLPTPSKPARIALTIDEAAGALGISRDHLERHILPELRIIYSGRRRLVPVGELIRWTDEHALAARASPRGR